jgi:hypothetical protein
MARASEGSSANHNAITSEQSQRVEGITMLKLRTAPRPLAPRAQPALRLLCSNAVPTLPGLSSSPDA